MQRITQTVLQRFTKTESINRARAVFVDFGSHRLPAGESAFTKALNDLSQSCKDRVPFEVTGAAAFI
ncbi:hypothetical protein D3C75_1228190 [compost metagenome]